MMSLKSTHMQFSPQGMRDTNGVATITPHKEENSAPLPQIMKTVNKYDKGMRCWSTHWKLKNCIWKDKHKYGKCWQGSTIRTAANGVFYRPTEGFIASITNKVVMMKRNEKTEHWRQYNRHTLDIYSRVIGLMQSRPLYLKEIMSHVLCSVPTSIFDRKCDINIAALTSSPKTGYR